MMMEIRAGSCFLKFSFFYKTLLHIELMIVLSNIMCYYTFYKSIFLPPFLHMGVVLWVSLSVHPSSPLGEKNRTLKFQIYQNDRCTNGNNLRIPHSATLKINFTQNQCSSAMFYQHISSMMFDVARCERFFICKKSTDNLVKDKTWTFRLLHILYHCLYVAVKRNLGTLIFKTCCSFWRSFKFTYN